MSSQAFRFLHEPQSEQEVVCLFMALLDDFDEDELERPVVIEQVRSAFPDCTILAGGKRIRIEFELYGRHFDHCEHDCEMLVCWRDDRSGWRPGFRVLELATVVARKRQELFITIDETYPKPWNETTFFVAAEHHGTVGEDIALTHRILELAKEHRFGPAWLVSAKPQFAVGRPHSFFKIGTKGRIGFPFRYLHAGDSFPELVERLNRAVPTLDLQPTDANAKNRGRLLSEIFKSDQHLKDFFGVWSWFATRPDA